MDLFEAAEARRRASGSEGMPEPMTVSALTALIKAALEEGFPEVCVVGQVSNISRAPSGHVYLTLKDEGSEIAAVIWRSTAQRIPFRIENGQEIVVSGRIAVYERRGSYQIVINVVQPKGVGALQLAFMQMRDKLSKEGLFDPLRKRELPFLPRTIAIVTSPMGAAIHDMLTMIGSRMPNVHVLICPVAVQGDGAAPQIAAAIRELNRMGGIDVMIVGRGGGSIEDLWPFNEEIVARAIFESAIPVISAVGHETDVSISDLVADVRALTPTHAGELVVPSREALDERLQVNARHLVRALAHSVRHARARVDAAARSHGMRLPLEAVRQRQQTVDELTRRLSRGAELELMRRRELVERKNAALGGLSPFGVLARGYSITVADGASQPLRSAKNVPLGTRLRTILNEGELRSTVDESQS